MSRRLFSAGLLMAAIIACTALPTRHVHAQKKKAGPGNAQKNTVDSAKLAASDYLGILKNTPGSDRKFTLEIEQDQLVANGAAKAPRGGAGHMHQPKPPNTARLQQAQQHILQAQGRMASARKPQDFNKAQADLNKAHAEYNNALNQVLIQSNAQTNAAILASVRKSGAGVPTGYRVVKTKTLVEFQHTETVKVRTTILPDDFDEKGNPKKYTKAELAELKGKDKNLGGYESALEKLEVGQKVRVTLVAASKLHKKPIDKNLAKDKDVEKEEPEADKDPELNKKMLVRLIVIAEAAKPTDTPPKTKKK